MKSWARDRGRSADRRAGWPRLWAAWLVPALLCSTAAADCPGCHRAQAEAFTAAAMAAAASAGPFAQEWAAARRDASCLRCHAPSGGAGVVCRDCHDAGHGAPARGAAACARCHDAPGEVAVRSHARKGAASGNRTCLDCHPAHAFPGPSTPGFLDGVARLELLLSRQGEVVTATIRIRHRAGHAVPGGTTGRSVWLVAEATDRDGVTVWTGSRRFGWLGGRGGALIEHLLPAGKPAIIEWSIPADVGARRLEVRLIYRFAAGPLDVPDPRQVMLDQAGADLP